MNVVRLAGVSDSPIDLDALQQAVADPRAGAVVTFSGVVRDHDQGRAVADLEYHGHPTSDAVVARVAAEIAERFEVIAVAVQHRVGLLTVGDIALGAAVAAAHRQQAFEGCTELVDQVKAQLPVWKRQVFTDGSDEWVGSA